MKRFEFTGVVDTNGAVISGNIGNYLEGPIKLLNFEVDCPAASANGLQDFIVTTKGQFGREDNMFGGTDWASTSIVQLLFVSTQKPNNLSVGSHSKVNMTFTGIDNIRFMPKSSAGQATITVRGTYE